MDANETAKAIRQQAIKDFQRMKVMKISKEEVNYRKATGKQRCGNCSMFKKGNIFSKGTCSLVAGEIAPGDVCSRWKPEDKQ